MIVSDIRYQITIVATKGDKTSHIIEISRPGLLDRHVSVGRNNSVPNIVGRIINEIEFETEKDNEPE